MPSTKCCATLLTPSNQNGVWCAANSLRAAASPLPFFRDGQHLLHAAPLASKVERNVEPANRHNRRTLLATICGWYHCRVGGPSPRRLNEYFAKCTESAGVLPLRKQCGHAPLDRRAVRCPDSGSDRPRLHGPFRTSTAPGRPRQGLGSEQVAECSARPGQRSPRRSERQYRGYPTESR